MYIVGLNTGVGFMIVLWQGLSREIKGGCLLRHLGPLAMLQDDRVARLVQNLGVYYRSLESDSEIESKLSRNTGILFNQFLPFAALCQPRESTLSSNRSRISVA